MPRRAAQGTGTIRKKTVTRSGKEYTYWEARYTTGTDPGTGKQIQRPITGKTQREVSQKLKAATAAIDAGTYTAPSRMTVGEWLDIWAQDYLGGVKPFTVASYNGQIRNHIKPALGTVRLEALNAHTIQRFYNDLSKPHDDKPGLSPKTVKGVHGVLHKALQQAVMIGYIRFNPSDACTLPRMVRPGTTAAG
ncbi:MAG: N-terminal phage integrase SAM-like domain-containing protein [Intestinimonas sp.]|nr:N-terminal phage integrase SAM-like domain-containing protein [Intestinimonas sp.]